MMKKRIASLLLALVLLLTLIPIQHVEAVYGNRAKLAWEYLYDYIEQHHQEETIYDFYKDLGSDKIVETVLQEDDELVDFCMIARGISVQIRLFFDNSVPPTTINRKLQTVNLCLVQGYWDQDDADNFAGSELVRVDYEYEEPWNGHERIARFKLSPAEFPKPNAAKFTTIGFPEEELEEIREKAFDHLQDILSLVEPILQEGGFSVADLGFNGCVGHTNHKWWGVPEKQAATCTTDGFEKKNCYICGEEIVKTLPASHNWVKTGKILSEPSCTEPGSVEANCKTCGAHGTIEILTLGHELSFVKVLTPVSEGQHGTARYKCTRCGATVTDEFCAATVFVDMPKWYSPAHMAVDWAYTHKPYQVTAGMDATHFGPERTVTRAQAMTFFWAAKDKPKPQTTNSPFADVKKSDWFYKPVLWAVENKITAGTDATHFSPNKTCNRGEILAFLYASLKKPKVSIKNPYKDVSNQWYKKAALWAYSKGIEKGESGKFNASTPCTRASTVTYLYRFMTGKDLAK